MRESRRLLRGTLAVASGVAVSCGGGRAGDPALVRAVVREWQEGPTDGTLCFDPRPWDVTALGGPAPLPRAWPAAVLDTVLADTLVRLSRPAQMATAGPRAPLCEPKYGRVLLAVSVPRVHGDSADVSAVVANSGVPRERTRPSVRLLRFGRRGARWVLLDQPGMRFELLRDTLPPPPPPVPPVVVSAPAG